MRSPEIRMHPGDNAVVCRRAIQIFEALGIDGVQVTVRANGIGHKIALVAVAAGSRITKYAPEVDEVATEIFSLVESIAPCVERTSDHWEFALTYGTFEPGGRDCLRDRREWPIRGSG